MKDETVLERATREAHSGVGAVVGMLVQTAGKLGEEAGNVKEALEQLVAPYLQPVLERVEPFAAIGRFVFSGSLELYNLVDSETKAIGLQFLLSQLLWTVCQISFYARYSSLLSALESKVSADLYREFIIQTTLQAVCSSAWSYQTLCFNSFSLNLRKSLTSELVDTYLSRRLYYNRANLNIPEHALGREVQVFAENLLNAMARIVFPGIRVAILANMIAPVTPKVALLLSVYALYMLGVIAYVRLDFEALRRKSYGTQRGFEDALRRVEDAAESLAFYRGEHVERARILRQADGAIRASSKFLRATFIDDLFRLVNCDIVLLFPLVIFSPEYFSGQIDIAGMMYIKHMFYNTYAAVTELPKQLDICKSLYNSFVALTRISQAQQHEQLPRTDSREVDGSVPLMHIEGLRVRFAQRDFIFRNATFTVQKGEYVYVEGGNGSGKSTLFRVCARLLDEETAKVDEFYSIDENRILFLPQRPYILASANLREQLLFPRWRVRSANRPSDQELKAVLEELTLWQRVIVEDRENEDETDEDVLDATLSNAQLNLSGGETQLVGFARLILALRRIAETNNEKGTEEDVLVFLDEATSALFPETEALVYGVLQAECDTIVSISHRDSLRDLHNRFVTVPDDLESNQ